VIEHSSSAASSRSASEQEPASSGSALAAAPREEAALQRQLKPAPRCHGPRFEITIEQAGCAAAAQAAASNLRHTFLQHSQEMCRDTSQHASPGQGRHQNSPQNSRGQPLAAGAGSNKPFGLLLWQTCPPCRLDELHTASASPGNDGGTSVWWIACLQKFRRQRCQSAACPKQPPGLGCVQHNTHGLGLASLRARQALDSDQLRPAADEGSASSRQPAVGITGEYRHHFQAQKTSTILALDRIAEPRSTPVPRTQAATVPSQGSFRRAGFPAP